ncbi:tripartite tricarboxylate transporter substrate binding protein [Pigmentiphaga soli]|uniref:Tripartite tricarboxylate transporter substrate binding protein n=1 Tax=Pigmentiphaga soli TaxID=1007095 RepID=A0ABP8GPW5_9BURK
MLTNAIAWRRCRNVLAALIATAAGAGSAWAQAYPTKQIHVIVMHSPGSSGDTVARTVIPRMSEILGQPMVIENQAGLGGVVGATQLSRADKDGYTLGVVSLNYAINPSLTKVTYDPIKDIVPVSIMTSGQAMLTVNSKVPAKNLQELLAYARSKPEQQKLTYGSPGVGSVFHLAFELLASATNTHWLHVPYKTSSGFMTDLMGGQIDAGFVSPGLAVPLIKAGKVRPIAVGSLERAKVLPDVPTLDESGVPGYDVNSWVALLAPAGTPDAVIDKLNATAVKVLRMPEVVNSLAEAGYGVTASSPQEAQATIKSDLAKYAKVIKDAGIQIQ